MMVVQRGCWRGSGMRGPGGIAMKQFGIRQLGTLMCVRLSEREPTDDEWESFSKAMRDRLGRIDRVLLWSDGGNLNTKRRREAIALVNQGGLRAVLWSEARAVRGAGCAIGWDTEGAVKGVLTLERASEFLPLSSGESAQVQTWLFGDEAAPYDEAAHHDEASPQRQRMR